MVTFQILKMNIFKRCQNMHIRGKLNTFLKRSKALCILGILAAIYITYYCTTYFSDCSPDYKFTHQKEGYTTTDKVLFNKTELVRKLFKKLSDDNIDYKFTHQKEGYTTTDKFLFDKTELVWKLFKKMPDDNIESVSINKTDGKPEPLIKDIYENGHLGEVSSAICPNKGNSLKLLIVIASDPSHKEARRSIRSTWGKIALHHNISITFVIGRSTNKTLEDDVTQENKVHADLIRGFYSDTYRNLTLKVISALEWVDKNCPHVKFVLKTDDDMFINIPKLMEIIKKYQNNTKTILGNLMHEKPHRNKKSKWYVSEDEFPGKSYPVFTSGPAYLMSSDILHKLYEQSLTQSYLYLEDVFFTGIVAEQLAIKRVHIAKFVTKAIPLNICYARNVISIHEIKPKQQLQVLQFLNGTEKNCMNYFKKFYKVKNKQIVFEWI